MAVGAPLITETWQNNIGRRPGRRREMKIALIRVSPDPAQFVVPTHGWTRSTRRSPAWWHETQKKINNSIRWKWKGCYYIHSLRTVKEDLGKDKRISFLLTVFHKVLRIKSYYIDRRKFPTEHKRHFSFRSDKNISITDSQPLRGVSGWEFNTSHFVEVSNTFLRRL